MESGVVIYVVGRGTIPGNPQPATPSTTTTGTQTEDEVTIITPNRPEKYVIKQEPIEVKDAETSMNMPSSDSLREYRKRPRSELTEF